MTELVTVTAGTVERHGFFCKMSARKTKAWQDKRDWLLQRYGACHHRPIACSRWPMRVR